MNKFIAVVAYIQGMSFEDREQLIEAWEPHYDRSRANRPVIDTMALGMKRTKAINAYYTEYNIDNLYEYCVFKNAINVINRFARTLRADGGVMNSGFTLGHWRPAGRGGKHLPVNWFVQVAKENFNLGDNPMEHPVKWNFQQQMVYVFKNCPVDVDKEVVPELYKYIALLGNVY